MGEVRAGLAAAAALAVLGGCAAGEALNWLVVLRAPKFRAARAEVERLKRKAGAEARRLAQAEGEGKEKEGGGKEKGKGKAGKGKAALKALEEQIKEAELKLAPYTLTSTLISTMASFGMVFLLNPHMSGVVVARLPFEPPSFLRGITHRGLAGEDYRECSHAFIFTLSVLCFQTLVQKFAGVKPANPMERMSKKKYV